MTRKNTPTPDMLKVFETVPDLYLILSPDLYILTASDAYLNTAHIIRQEIVGKHLLEVFPNHEDAHHAETINNIQASLQEVLSTQKPLQMEVQRYDIPQPSAPGDGFEKKYWKPVNTPVLDEEGEIRYIIHKIIDATEHQSDQQQIYDLSDREQAALAEAEWERNKLREILMQAPVAIGIYEGKNHIIELINPLMSEVIGRKADEVLGKALFEALPELEGQGYETVLSEVYSSGKPIEFKESPATLNRNGKLVQGFYHTVYQPIKNAKGEVSGIINIVTDISEQVENRQKVEESELRFRTLMESIPQMAWTNLPNGEVNFYNQRWQEYTGLSLEQIYGWGWQPLLHPEDLDDMLVTYLKSLETGSEFVHENRLKRQDGSYRWHLNRSVPLRDEKGKISLWVGTSTDIHEQKMLEQRLMESEQYFRMMADNVPVMIWITDPNGQCTYLNKQWYDYTGQTQETALGLGWLHAVHPDDSQTAADVFLNANDKQIPFNLTYRLKRKDNKIRWYVDIGLPKFSAEGEFEGFVGVVIDIHERKLAEEAVQKLSHELAAINEELRAANEEIQANNEELSSSNQQLSFINADMDNFIYTASHDLRAPISNIEGLMAALLRNLTEEDQKAPMINKLSGMITKSIDRFKKTLEDLTQITKVQREGSGEDITQIDLTQVISEVQLDLATQIEQADAQFEITLNHCTLIHFSAKNARSIVYNLLSNAIKYRSPLRQTFVRVSCYPEGDYLVLSVEDNGLGMNLSDESKIFAMFKRLHDHVEGTGVGLYIVKKIIENAGGKIEVQSTLDQGTTFKVYFKQST